MATVLVVDDEADLCQLIRVNLVLDGHTVLVAHDGEAGLRTAEVADPDLVILDVMMPGRDGFDVLAAIKAAGGPLAATPVVMLTARAAAIDRVKGGIEGAVRYLTKPFSVVDLRALVTEVLSVDEGLERRRAQTDALSQLARLEAGRRPGRTDAPRPRLTRYEPAGGRAVDHSPPPPPGVEHVRSLLTARQGQLLDAVLAAPDLRSAADDLGVSRSYLYASLRRIAQKVGLSSGPELVATVRAEEARAGRRGRDGA